MKTSSSNFLDVRGLKLHIRTWGSESAPLLMLLHGWGDMSASWQFVVDELRRDWRVVAPDWRGFGLSQWTGKTYYAPDYLADLDALLDRYSPDAPARIVAHSMGGNVASIYAGTFPSRISHIVNLEGIGMVRTSPEQAPERYATWLRMLKQPQGFRGYRDRENLAARLCDDNPRLTPERARFLAEHIGVENASGGIDIAIDPAHRLKGPILYRVEEAMACWRRITASVLLITGEDSLIGRRFLPPDTEEGKRFSAYRNLKEVRLADCGHNVHHDQPAVVARLIEEFVS